MTTLRSDYAAVDASRVAAGGHESGASAVSWGAIVAGAVGAAAIGLLLVILGSGLGLSSISAWSNEGASASTIGWSTIIWLTLTQLIAAGLGGYLAGRLRTHWVSVKTDEVYFRDTAHGFLAWALSVIITVVLLASAVTSVLGGAGRVVGSLAGGAAQTVALVAGGSESGSSSAQNGFVDYYVHALIRRSDVNVPQTGLTSSDASTQADEAAWLTQEITPIVVQSISRGEFAEADRNYVAQLIARYTNISQQEARSRIDSTVTEIEQRLKQAEDTAREAAESARKAAAYTALWIAISLLIGAFTAALFATFGGRLRDNG